MLLRAWKAGTFWSLTFNPRPVLVALHSYTCTSASCIVRSLTLNFATSQPNHRLRALGLAAAHGGAGRPCRSSDFSCSYIYTPTSSAIASVKLGIFGLSL